jgi:hypothetical protein
MRCRVRTSMSGWTFRAMRYAGAAMPLSWAISSSDDHGSRPRD